MKLIASTLRLPSAADRESWDVDVDEPWGGDSGRAAGSTELDLVPHSADSPGRGKRALWESKPLSSGRCWGTFGIASPFRPPMSFVTSVVSEKIEKAEMEYGSHQGQCRGQLYPVLIIAHNTMKDVTGANRSR